MGGDIRKALEDVVKGQDEDKKYVYHATNMNNLRDIANDGKLNTHKPWHGTDQRTWPDGKTEKRAYFTPEAEHAWKFAPAEGESVVLRMEHGKHVKREQYTGDLYVRHPVTSAGLEYHNGTEWRPVDDLKEENDG